MPNLKYAVMDHRGRLLAIDIYEDGNVWIDHPDTGLRIGIGRSENDERQAFVHVNTEDQPEAETFDGEPVLHIALNDADVYDVTKSGPTARSTYHDGERWRREQATRKTRAAELLAELQTLGVIITARAIAT